MSFGDIFRGSRFIPKEAIRTPNYTYLHQEFIGALKSCWQCDLNVWRREGYTITCLSKDVPTAESFAF